MNALLCRHIKKGIVMVEIMIEPAGYSNSFEMIVITHCLPMYIDHFIVVFVLIAQTWTF
jgi:hypothetical protein